ncbi:glycosyltransferase family 2 protein [Pararhizobium mangrovi]|uniref:Glycosyltransferase family 2 protein n=1 Tax=Pararhizobium mangrovi TaxID=2590452 RepID=A0A506U9R8_9HYPH|nr:glycosyltransferase family 2 protein [Pararhizobium mangrovi]TPW31182.1 glycosyltransferase family 2 protein [Pararhizobium mangrovi]
MGKFDDTDPIVALTILVRNEADIIETNIDFHRRAGFDVIIVTDNASTDGTSEILRQREQLGQIVLLQERSDAYRQDAWATRMALLARETYGADWVLSGDADEFWVVPGGSIKDELTNRKKLVLACERRNMVTDYETLGREPWWEALIYRADPPVPMPKNHDRIRDPLPAPYFFLQLPGKSAFSLDGLERIERGAHNAVYDSGKPQKGECGIVIYHFPLRDIAEFERSTRQIGAAIRSDASLQPNTSWKYRRWLAQLEAAGSIDTAVAEALPSSVELSERLMNNEAIQDTWMRDRLRKIVA